MQTVLENVKQYKRESLVSNVQSLSLVPLFLTPWTAAYHISMSFSITQSLLKLRTSLVAQMVKNLPAV